MVLSKGEKAPDFEFINRDGKVGNLLNIDGKKIVFFFPKAFTKSCTAEACSLQDNYADLKQSGVSEIFGISMDPKEKQDKFQEKYGLDYILVNDDDGEISKKYGVYARKFLLFKISERYTFVVDENNLISETFENGLRGDKSKYGMDKHGEEILEFLELS